MCHGIGLRSSDVDIMLYYDAPGVYYDVLGCTMMFYGVLWCTMMYYDVLWCTAMYYVLPWCTTMYSDVLRCTMLYYDVLWCTMMYSAVLWCTMMYYYEVLWCTMMYYVVPWCTVMYYDVLCVVWCRLVHMQSLREICHMADISSTWWAARLHGRRQGLPNNMFPPSSLSTW